MAFGIFLLIILTLVFLIFALDLFGNDKMRLNEIHKVDLDDKFTNLSIVALDMLKVIFNLLKLCPIINISKLNQHIVEPDDKILNCYRKSILNLLKRRKPNWHVDFHLLDRIIWLEMKGQWKVNEKSYQSQTIVLDDFNGQIFLLGLFQQDAILFTESQD